MSTSDNLSGAYALDALSAADRADHEAALFSSEEARSEAAELQDTAVLLGLAVPPVPPSAELKQRLLAQIADTAQFTGLDAAPGPAETRARRHWSRPIATAASLAAAVALIVGGIAVGTTSLHPEPSFQAQQMAALDNASDRRELDSAVAGGGTATLVWSHALATSAVVMEGVQPPPDSSVYQLWYIGDAGARSAGFIEPESTEKAWRVLDGTMELGDTVGVTVEPTGGSEQPTTTPIVQLPSL